MIKVNWKGVYPAVTTKFNRDGSLDISAFRFNIEKQLEAGVDGIVLGGTLGESSVLEPAEKSSLIKATKKVVNGKIPVIMNIAEGSTRVAINAAQQAKADEVDGLMLLPPMRYSSDHRETVEYFKSIAAATDLPIMIYNNPVDYKTEVTLDMFQELADCPTIKAVKESTRDISNVTRMINRFGDRFKILSGVDTLALESLCLGADGWVAGLVCAFPKETVAIYRLMKAGRLPEALSIYRWFLPLLELDINAKLVQNIKLAESIEGVGTEWVRAPRLLLYGEERAHVTQIIEHGIATRPALPDYMNL
ncbi:MAG: dihydrodipicolinate synthase/N-acetylneuraminate lyase [Flavobacteriales bacterium]|jgi:dihydrodipicolinate synthase/N-acetylneuraminate lyase